ncbi:MAG TPA: GMC oxidoreductase, partial [Stellaceae bacterium]
PETWTARTRGGGEVIVCGGSVNSPQLLQLSGIGPAELLRGHGIPVLHELPGVGAGLQDHFQVRMVFKCTRKVTVNDDLANPLRTLGMGLRYALFRTGPLTVSAGYAGAFFRTDPARLATADVQVHFITFSTDRMGDRLHRFSGFTASVCQLRPESRGSVRIKSPDPAAAPEIRPNYLAAERDRAVNVAGLRVLRRIMGMPAMRPFVAAEAEPGPEAESDEALLRHCRERGSTIYHLTSTCRMGPAEGDPLAVVDPRLRVRGIGRLRVVDGSVMPALVSGNTNAAIVMIAEKAADMILADGSRPEGG